MRRSSSAKWILPLLLGASATPLLAQAQPGGAPLWAQFNPAGRKRPPAQPQRPQTTSRPSPGSPDSTPRESPEARLTALIERYTRLLYEQPGEPHPLSRLIELIRQRDGTLSSLQTELEQQSQAGSPKRYAALLALGQLHQQTGQATLALRAYEQATQEDSQRPEAWLSLSRFHLSQSHHQEALSAAQRALPFVQGATRDEVLRQLRDLSVERENWSEAQRWQRELEKHNPGQLLVQGELGRLLLARGHTEQALPEFDRVVQRAQGDARALAPALRDRGKAHLQQGDAARAEQDFIQASRWAAQEPGLRREIDQLWLNAARQQNRLRELLTSWEQGPRDAIRLQLLASLYEETGQTATAIQTYQTLLQQNPHDVDAHLALIRLFELTGQLEQALRHYPLARRLAPQDTQLTLRYLSALAAQGQHSLWEAELDRFERQTNDPEVLLEILQFVEKQEDHPRAQRFLRKLETHSQNHPEQLLEVGARYYRDGQVERALSLWKKLIENKPEDARSQVLYGEVLLDHHQVEPGLAALQKATELAPQERRVRRSYALGLERALTLSSDTQKKALLRELEKQWTLLLEQAAGPEDAAETERQEASRHLVRLWQRNQQLPQQATRLRRLFEAQPPDLQAGRLLAEIYLKQQERDAAAHILSTLLKHRPGDRSSLILLYQLQESSSQAERALATGEQLVRVDPRRARAHLERLMRLAMRLHKTEQALRYGKQAVQLAPQDAQAYAQLGDLYAAHQQRQAAMDAYRKSLSLDSQREDISWKLAELLLQERDPESAWQLYLQLVQSSQNPEWLARATRKALTLANLKQLAELENLLLRQSIARPDREILSTLFLEVVAREMQELRAQLSPEEAENALRKISQRAQQPLLRSLLSPRVEEQRIALELFTFSPTQEHTAALLRYAESAAPEELRIRALLSLSTSSQQKIHRELLQLIQGPTRGRLAQAAAWSLAQLPSSTELRRAQLTLLEHPDPLVRALALWGRLRDPSPLTPTEIQNYTAWQRKALRTPLQQALLALLFARAPQQLDQLFPTPEKLPPLARAAFLHAKVWAHSSSRAASAQAHHSAVQEAVVHHLLAPQTELQRAALRSAALLLNPSPAPLLDELPLSPSPSELDPSEQLFTLLQRPPSAEQAEQALTLLSDSYIQVWNQKLQTAGPSTLALLHLVQATPTSLSFHPWSLALPTTPLATESSSQREIRQASTQSFQRILQGLQPALQKLAQLPEPALRLSALSLLRFSPTPEAESPAELLRAALHSPDEALRAAARTALLADFSQPAQELLLGSYTQLPHWAERLPIAQAFTATNSESPLTQEALRLIRQDPHPLVRRTLEPSPSNEAHLK